MTQVPDLQQRKSTWSLPKYFGSATLIIAFIVLTGWQFNVPILAAIVPGLGAMHPFVAISFIAIGLFFIVDGRKHSTALGRILGFGLPCIPIFVGGITLSQFIFHFSSPLEALFYPSELIAFGYKNVPNHITGSTALELLLTGATLFLMNFKGQKLDIFINNLSGLIGLICLLSYISCVYLIHEFHILVFITAMAILTGICLLLTSLAIMYSRPDSGIMSAFTSKYPGNRLARVFLPLSVIIPVVFGLITVYVLRHNVLTTEVGMTLLFTSLILSMFILTWYLGAQINRTNFEQLAKEKLRKSEFYYRSIIENASDAIMITNNRGDFSEVNSFMCELFGYTKDELLKLNIQQIIDPEQLKNDPIRFELLSMGKPFIKERRIVHKNGTIIEVRANVKMLPDGRMLAIASDMTERNKTERELAKSEAKFKALIENNFDAITLLDKDLKIIYRSPSAERVTSWSLEERIKHNGRMLLHPDDTDKVDEIYKMAKENEGKPFSISYRIRNRTGNYIWVEAVIRNMLSNPNIGAIVVIYRDITERKNAEQQLAKSEARFKALVENNFDAISLLDKNFKPIYRSPSTNKVTGWSDAERKDSTGYEILHPDDVGHVQETYKKIIENEGVPFSHSYRIRHKNGYYIWVESVTRNMLSDPEIGAIVVVMRDITERKKAEDELIEAEAMFRNLSEKSQVGIYIIQDWKYVYVNPMFAEIFGYMQNELINSVKIDIVLDKYDKEKIIENVRLQLKDGKKSFHYETKGKRKDGQFILFEIFGSKTQYAGKPAIIGTLLDVTHKRNAESKLLKYNRELFMLNHVNDAIVRYKDEDALINQTCSLLADYGNYPLAWIGFAPDSDEPIRRIEPIAKAGKEVKYLDSIIIDHVDERMKNGPAATALRTGKLRIINDIEKDLYFEPWRDVAKKHSLASIIALPFDTSEKRKGILVIYSYNSNAFDKDEVTILQRITENLAHAIRGIRITEERDNAIKQIVKSEEKYRLLFESNPLPMWMFSIPDFKMIDVNESALKHYGYSKEEFIAMKPKDLRPFEDIDAYLKISHEEREGIKNLGIWRHKKKNGEIINVEVVTHDIVYEGKKVRLVLALDVTEKMKADQELHNMNEQLRQFSAHLQNAREDERTKIAREIHDELGQLLTGLKIDVSWLSKKLNTSPEELTKRVDEMLQLTDHTIQSVRRIATELRPGILDDLGLEDAIIWQATEFQNKTGIRCDVEGELRVKKYSSDVSTAVFRILQESLTNVMRHANAKNVIIKMHESETALNVEVIDDGNGISPHLNGEKSLGIMGMKERASIIGGWFSITSEPFRGTRVRVEIPIKQ